jgi:hypothetical protein
MRSFFVLSLVFVLSGCASFLHASDPTIDADITAACGLLAQQHAAEIQARAKAKGLSPADVANAFKVLCVLRMQESGHLALEGAAP